MVDCPEGSCNQQQCVPMAAVAQKVIRKSELTPRRAKPTQKHHQICIGACCCVSESARKGQNSVQKCDGFWLTMAWWHEASNNCVREDSKCTKKATFFC